VTAQLRRELEPARHWSAALVTALDDITDHVGAAARHLADHWPDARGHEWADRLNLLHRALEGHAVAAAELGQSIDRAADDVSGPDDGSLGYGPLLGGTGGRHVDDRRGVTIPRLNDDADDGG
jgi:hypothetical protein